jgi:hypothetical protein
MDSLVIEPWTSIQYVDVQVKIPPTSPIDHQEELKKSIVPL